MCCRVKGANAEGRIEPTECEVRATATPRDPSGDARHDRMGGLDSPLSKLGSADAIATEFRCGTNGSAN